MMMARRGATGEEGDEREPGAETRADKAAPVPRFRMVTTR